MRAVKILIILLFFCFIAKACSGQKRCIIDSVIQVWGQSALVEVKFPDGSKRHGMYFWRGIGKLKIGNSQAVWHDSRKVGKRKLHGNITINN